MLEESHEVGLLHSALQDLGGEHPLHSEGADDGHVPSSGSRLVVDGSRPTEAPGVAPRHPDSHARFVHEHQILEVHDCLEVDERVARVGDPRGLRFGGADGLFFRVMSKR